MSIKQGQIAHLDKNSANDARDNLAFLCFDHHDNYDSSTRQSKNLTRLEVKEFRAELHQAVKSLFKIETSFQKGGADKNMIVGNYIRNGNYDSAEVDVQKTKDGLYHVSGEALWGIQREYGPNIGSLDFISELGVDNTLKYVYEKPEGEPYRATLFFSAEGLTIVEENLGYVFGMNVYFAGDYIRTT